MTFQDGPRTYGHWRKPGKAGLNSLSSLATGILFGGLIIAMLAQMIGGLIAGLSVVVALGVILTLVAVKDRHGLTVAQRLGERMFWLKTKSRGSHQYRSGPAGKAPWGTFQLPGVLASTKLSEFEDSYGRRCALLEYPGYYSIVFRGEPDGQALVDQSDVDRWVAMWGAWLAGLGQEQGVVGASVTIETAPDTGTRLRKEVEARIVSDAPDVAKQMLREAIAQYPAGSAVVRAFITVSYAASPRSGMRRRESQDMARDLATRIPGLIAELSSTGAGTVQPISAFELCRAVRCGYDPAAEAIFDDAVLSNQDVELSWADVGPAAYQEAWDCLRHDSGVSITWSMTEAPRGIVQSGILARLLAPHAAIARKRVTILYRPIEAGRASAIVEADVRAAQVRATSSKMPSARVDADLQKARATAREEAAGAGLENFGLIVTATGHSESELPEIAATVDSLAAQARIAIRRMYGSQSAGFAAGLPVGMVPIRHSTVPEIVREAL